MENNSIGIIGGGQLCQMLSEYLDSIGKKVYFIDPSENPPAKNTNAIHIRKDAVKCHEGWFKQIAVMC